MLNPIEKFKVAILHLKRDWNHCGDLIISLKKHGKWSKLISHKRSHISDSNFMNDDMSNHPTLLLNISCICDAHTF